MSQSSKASVIDFTTHIHGVIRHSVPSKGIYPSGADLEPGTSQLLAQDGNSEHTTSICGASEPSVPTTPYFVFDTIEFMSQYDGEVLSTVRRSPFAGKVTSLAIDLGISSSVWQLGGCDAISGSSNKSEPMDSSLVVSLLNTLFKRLNDPADCDASHVRLEYYFKIKCYEVFGDQIRDLLCDPGGSNPAAIKVREHPVFGTFVSGLAEKACLTAEDAYNTLQSAFQRRIMLIVGDNSVESKAVNTVIQCKAVGTVGTVIVTLEVNQTLISRTLSSTASSDVLRRAAVVQINTLADAESLSFKPAKSEGIYVLPLAYTHRLRIYNAQDTIAIAMPTSEAVQVQVSQLAAGAKAMTSLSRVLTALQHNLSIPSSGTTAGADSSKLLHVPYRECTLTRVLQPMLEGRYVNYVYCHLIDDSELSGAASATAMYALRLSMELRAGVVSRVSPNEEHIPYNKGDNPVVDKWLELVQHSLQSVDPSEQLMVSAPTELASAMDSILATTAGSAGPDSSAFWNLLHSLQASRLDTSALQDLEALQRERDKLLRSLDGTVVPALSHNVNGNARTLESSWIDGGGNIGGAGTSSMSEEFPLAKLIGEMNSLGHNSKDSPLISDAALAPVLLVSVTADSNAAQTANDSRVDSLRGIEIDEAARPEPGAGATSPRLTQHADSPTASPVHPTKLAPLSASTSAKSRPSVAKLGTAGAVASLGKTSSAKVAAVPSVQVVRSQDSSDATAERRAVEGPSGVDKPISRTVSSGKVSRATPVLSPVKVASNKLAGTRGAATATSKGQPIGPARQTGNATSTSTMALGSMKTNKKEFTNNCVAATAGGDLVSIRVTASPSPPSASALASPGSLHEVESALVVRFPALQDLFQQPLKDSSIAAVTPRLMGSAADRDRWPSNVPIAAAETDTGGIGDSNPSTGSPQNVLWNSVSATTAGVSTPPTGTASSTRSSSADKSNRSRSSSQSVHGSPSMITRKQSARSLADVVSTPPRTGSSAPIATHSSGPDSAMGVLPSIVKAGVTSPSPTAPSAPASEHKVSQQIADVLPSLDAATIAPQPEDGQDISSDRVQPAESTRSMRGIRTKRGGGDDDAEGSHLSELEAQFLRAVSLTNLNMIAQCLRMKVNVHVKNGFDR